MHSFFCSPKSTPQTPSPFVQPVLQKRLTRTVHWYSPVCTYRTHDYLGPRESITQTASRSIQRFFAQLTAECRRACEGMSFPLKINPTLWGDLDAYLIGLHASLGPPESKSQTAADRFSRFGTAHSRVSLYFTMDRPLPLPIMPCFLIIYTAIFTCKLHHACLFFVSIHHCSSFIDPEGMIVKDPAGTLFLQ